MFGTEVCDFPEPVVLQIRLFFVRNVLWLLRVFQTMGRDERTARIQACTRIATLKGDMILSQRLQDGTLLDQIVAGTGWARPACLLPWQE